MSLVTRAQKGSKLSSAEMDDNLLWLSQTLSGSDGTGIIQVTGSSLDASNTPITSSFFTGDGSALTNITASYLPGIDGSQLLNVTASYISPSITIPVNGTNTQIQFNSGSVLSGSNNLVYNYDSQSLEHGNNNHTTIGLYSHAEGSNTTTLGDYSHTEGTNTRTGIYGYKIISANLNGSDTDITLSGSYANIVTTVNSASYILIHDVSANSIIKNDFFNASWDAFNTIVTVYGIDLTSLTDGDIIALSNVAGSSLQSRPSLSDQKVAGTSSHAEGISTFAINDYSHTEGISSIAAGQYSHAEGLQSITLGTYSHAEGYQTTALGNSAHSEGYQAIAVGNYSHAEGFSTIASGSYSHAEGAGTIALGNSAHAEGYLTTASANYSHAEGLRTIASGDYQLVVGQWNVASTSQSAFIVGDGTANNARHNVLFVSKSYFEVSASNMYFQGLANSSQTYVVAIDTNTGQLSYTLASGVGSLTPPGGNNTAIQFNSGSSFSGSNKFTYDYGNNIVTLTGSLRVSGSITGSLLGTASWATSASFVTGSVFTSANQALSASNALTASFVQTAQTASYVTGSVFTSANRALSASFALSSSQTTTASYALYALNGGTSGNPGGNPGEIQYNNGNTTFDGVPTLTYDGAILTATGSFTGSFVGSFTGTASWAESASQALTASFVRTAQTASYVLTAQTASYVLQAVSASFASTASFVLTAQTASYVLQAVSASFASTASYVTGSIFTSTNRALSASNALTSSFNSNMRASSASVSDFVSAGGGDYISNPISFSPIFPNNNYAITITGEDARSWTIQSKLSSSFVINTNSSVALSGPVYWIAMQFNN
jgi:hypothetical protein